MYLFSLDPIRSDHVRLRNNAGAPIICDGTELCLNCTAAEWNLDHRSDLFFHLPEALGDGGWAWRYWPTQLILLRIWMRLILLRCRKSEKEAP